MKLKFSFIEKHRQKKEALKREKEEEARRKAEEEARRKAEEEKKKKKETLILVAVILVGLIGLSIGSKDDKNSTIVQSPTPSITDSSIALNESEISKPSTGEAAETLQPEDSHDSSVQTQQASFSPSVIPAYSGLGAYIAINNNIPYFTKSDYSTTAFESYSPLDSLGRCGVAYANVCQEIMPTEPRGSIGQIKPSGWHTITYDCVDGRYLYNRCHLIGYQLSAEGANPENLITGTRYLNINGMLPFENMVADYVKETNNHVLYRVVPVFDGSNLVATGVLIEALSVEDKGEGICFNVFSYNVQPDVTINYANGDSSLNNTVVESIPETVNDGPPTRETTSSTQPSAERSYVLNTNTHKFHYQSCSSVNQIKDGNRQEYTGSREDLIAQGYEACKRCNP